MKNTRFRHLEAFDQVIQKKFANLEFPKLPDKTKVLNFSKEKDRKQYLQEVLDLILKHGRKHPDLKGQLFQYLYNLLLRGEVRILKKDEVKQRDGVQRSETRQTQQSDVSSEMKLSDLS